MPQTFPGFQFPKLPVNSQTISSGSGGLAVVDTTSNILERKDHNLPSLQDDDRLRCLSSGMGSHLQRNVNQGPLVSLGADPTYQLLGAPGSYSAFANENSGISILLRIDNATVVAYINRKGETVSPTLSNQAKTLWL